MLAAILDGIGERDFQKLYIAEEIRLTRRKSRSANSAPKASAVCSSTAWTTSAATQSQGAELFILTAQRRFDLMAFLTPDQMKEVEEKLGTLLPKYNKLLLKLPFTRFQQEKAAEYFRHGFVRRVGTLAGALRRQRFCTYPDGYRARAGQERAA